jgi:hypothetical protein
MGRLSTKESPGFWIVVIPIIHPILRRDRENVSAHVGTPKG